MATILQEVHMTNALTHYCYSNGATAEDFAEDNPFRRPTGENFGFETMDDIQWAHPTIPKPTVQQVIDAYNQWEAETQASTAQTVAIKTVEEGSKTQATNIPGWATWTEVEALTWHDTNIAAELPVANLAEANIVLQRLETENRALVRMLLAIRNKVFPDLEGSG